MASSWADLGSGLGSASEGLCDLGQVALPF